MLWWQVDRFEQWLHFSAERHPQSAARSSATVVKSTIGRAKPTRQPGIERFVPRTANWREPGVGTHRDRQASNAVVARANRRLAQAYLSARREPSRVTRDHLPQPLHPGAWRPEEGAAPALEAHARHASVSASHAEDRHPRADRRCRVDQRTACVRRGSRGAWSLGRRSDVRRSQQPDRNAGRAADAVRRCSSRWRAKTRRRSSTR